MDWSMYFPAFAKSGKTPEIGCGFGDLLISLAPLSGFLDTFQRFGNPSPSHTVCGPYCRTTYDLRTGCTADSIDRCSPVSKRLRGSRQCHEIPPQLLPKTFPVSSIFLIPRPTF
ncbi:hypothetical protein SCLCIDRAFT_1225027 [Scleroderma citrinum Foug A]|uniref:Uncharacterized protein n=1 Tax=Scleroderma citrinum Foug A TaxID=1036808 RepID=A0A0C2ZD43_9AGAM|nr:hypothetical protein SCLCIDRAFT_1225027 [Scleroderma citrinum Foug A]